MQVNNIRNQQNFGMKDVIPKGASRQLAERVNRIKPRLLAIGEPTSFCEVSGTTYIAKAKVKIPDGTTTIEDYAIDSALSDDGLVALVTNANRITSKKIMDGVDPSRTIH